MMKSPFQTRASSPATPSTDHCGDQGAGDAADRVRVAPIRSALVGLVALLSMIACSGGTTEADDNSSDDGTGGTLGDGDVTGDGDGNGTGGGDVTGDGDGDGTGGMPGDGDGSGGLVGDGDGDDEDVPCNERTGLGLTVTVHGGSAPALPPPTKNARVVLPECLATVTATDGAYEEQLYCYATGVDCYCSGAYERAGTYTVTAVQGDKEETEVVVVSTDDCGIITEQVDLFQE
jgi:hypothetical protein